MTSGMRVGLQREGRGAFGMTPGERTESSSGEVDAGFVRNDSRLIA